MRTHVVLPEELVEGVDELVGARGRSRFIAEATAEKLRKDRLVKAIREGAGILDPKKHPHWSTPEKTAEWLRELRDTPSIRRDPIDEVPVGRKRADRLAKGPRTSSRPSRRAKQPR